jgi:hypothetical protein
MPSNSLSTFGVVAELELFGERMETHQQIVATA